MLSSEDKSRLLYLLTLRYNPLKSSFIRPLTKEDFKNTFSDIQKNNVDSDLEKLVEKKLKDLELSQDKTISLALSGGIDSGFTLVMLRKIFPNIKIHSICVGFGDDDDELSQAKEIAQRYECDFDELYVDNILTDLPKLISIVQEPRWNLYQFYPLEKGKKFSDLFFSGDGGDELFGGYIFRYKKFLSGLRNITCLSWVEKAKLYLSCHERDWVPDQDKMFYKDFNFSWDKIYKNFQSYFDNDLYPLNQVFLADFNGKLLYDWIPSNYYFGKFLNLEIKSLFLDSDIISFSTMIPWNIKYDIDLDVGKLPLLHLLNKFPGFKNFSGIKKGFSLNLSTMWNNYGRDIVKSYLGLESEIVKSKIINYDWMDRAIKFVESTQDTDMRLRYINKLLSLLALEIWYKIFILKTLNIHTKL